MTARDARFKEFEREVERNFQVLGYAVSSQVLIAGRPVDLIIQKRIEPGIPLRTIVECRQRDRKKVTATELTDFVNGEIRESCGRAGNLAAVVGGIACYEMLQQAVG